MSFPTGQSSVSNVESYSTLEAYDWAFYEWLGQLHCDYGKRFGEEYVLSPIDLSDKSILRVFVSGERAFSDKRTLLVSQGFFPASELSKPDNVNEDGQIRILPTPYARIQRRAIEITSQKQAIPLSVRKWFSSGTDWLKVKAPRPYELIYTCDFVSRAIPTMNHIMEWLLGQFAPNGSSPNARQIAVRHPAPYNVQQAELELLSVTDTSVVETQGPNDVVQRYTVRFRLSAWDFDRNPERVPASYFPRFGVGLDGENGSDKDLGLYSGTFPPITERLMFDASKLPYAFVKPIANAVRVDRHWDASAPVLFTLNSGDGVYVTCLPWPNRSFVRIKTQVKWNRIDGVAPASLHALLITRDETTGQERTIQTQTLDPSTNEISFVSCPQDSNQALLLKIVASETIRLAVTKHRLWLAPTTNLLSAPNRTISGGTSANRSASSLDESKPYAVVFRNTGASTVNVTLTRTSPTTAVLDSKSVSAGQEYVFEGLLGQAATLAFTSGAALSISGILFSVLPAHLE